jgi:Hemopexin
MDGLAYGKRDNPSPAPLWPKLVDGRQKAYFFHHTAYIRYDLADNRADDNYPQPIEGNWRGL